jgi:uncharacterized protein
MSRKNHFAQLFGNPVLTPLHQHMSLCEDVSRKLIPLFDKAAAGNFDEGSRIRLAINELENEADELKRKFRMSLHSGLLLALSRNDLLQVINTQDKIANISRDIAGLICGRKIQIPVQIADETRMLLEASISAIEAASDAVEQIESMANVSGHVNDIESTLILIDDQEREADNIQIRLRRSLMDLEPDMDPMKIMFLYEVIHMLGDLSDKAQAVGDRVRIIMAH